MYKVTSYARNSHKDFINCAKVKGYVLIEQQPVVSTYAAYK